MIGSSSWESPHKSLHIFFVYRGQLTISQSLGSTQIRNDANDITVEGIRQWTAITTTTAMHNFSYYRSEMWNSKSIRMFRRQGNTMTSSDINTWYLQSSLVKNRCWTAGTLTPRGRRAASSMWYSAAGLRVFKFSSMLNWGRLSCRPAAARESSSKRCRTV